MMAKPNLKIFEDCFFGALQNIKNTVINKEIDYLQTILAVSGPVHFTKMLNTIQNKNVTILPSDFFCAGSWSGRVPLTKNSFIKHMYTFTWK